MEAVQRRDEVKEMYIAACKKNNKPVDEEIFTGPVTWTPERPYSDLEYLEKEGKYEMCHEKTCFFPYMRKQRCRSAAW